MKTASFTNVRELRDKLTEIFDKLEAGEMTLADAKERANIAGKVLSTIKVQLAYHALRSEAPNIEFLNDPEEPAKMIFNGRVRKSLPAKKE